METSISWIYFFKIVGILFVLYVVLRLLQRIVPNIFKRPSNRKKTTLLFNKSLEVYIPLAIVIILLSFVAVNFIAHGILLLLIVGITFTHIKRYLFGILFRINPLINIGSNITTGDYKGDIIKFLVFGVIINEDNGNRFVSYSHIDANGFSVNQNDVSSVRRTLYIPKQETSQPILDLLFENPNVDFSNKPILKQLPNEEGMQLQIALLDGAKIDSVIDYLKQYNITSSTSKIS